MSNDKYYAEWDLKACRAAKARKQPAPHQKAALSSLARWYERGPVDGEGGILVLPTGAGKTFTAIHFLCNGPLSDGHKVLWLAHTHHLLEQSFDGFPDSLPHIREPHSRLRLRVVSGTPGHYPPRDISPDDDVLIATLQTISNAHRDGLRQLRDFRASAKGKLFIVFDEAHHAPAPSYRKLLSNFCAEGARVLGLTATPTYSDEAKRGWLKKLFPQGILAQARVSDLIASGVLAKPIREQQSTSIVPTFDDAEYEKWLGTYRDIPEHVVDLLARDSGRNALIAETYARSREKYGKTIIFSDRWFQCEALVEALRQRGVRADAVYSHVDAKVPTVAERRKRSRDENAKVLERFRKSEIDVLVNVRMLTEGTDLPDARTVFLTRQTTSSILLTQMVGRALRGPKFGGTPEAYIVSFVDDWQQAIRWAEYDQLPEGDTDDRDNEAQKRPPLQLISIELIKQLARQMSSGVDAVPAHFTSFMPVGWYRVTYDALIPDTEEVESSDRLVMVFDDEQQGFESLIRELLETPHDGLSDEAAHFDDHRSALTLLRAKFFASTKRGTDDLLLDIFHIARHVAQAHGTPQFFPFTAIADHDLDALAAEYIADDLGPRAIHAKLSGEFHRRDRYWWVLFPRLEQFRAFYDSCEARLLSGAPQGSELRPKEGAGPSPSEPEEEVKTLVKTRDGHRCLACGADAPLHVDHIVPVYEGGTHQPSNLQTLCDACNVLKAKRTIRFTTHRTALTEPPDRLETPRLPDDLSDPVQWARHLRCTINFTLGCAAVTNVVAARRGNAAANWAVALTKENAPALLGPHLQNLYDRVNDARMSAGRPPLENLSITAPDHDAIEAPAVTPSRIHYLHPEYLRTLMASADSQPSAHAFLRRLQDEGPAHRLWLAAKDSARLYKGISPAPPTFLCNFKLSRPNARPQLVLSPHHESSFEDEVDCSSLIFPTLLRSLVADGVERGWAAMNSESTVILTPAAPARFFNALFDALIALPLPNGKR